MLTLYQYSNSFEGIHKVLYTLNINFDSKATGMNGNRDLPAYVSTWKKL